MSEQVLSGADLLDGVARFLTAQEPDATAVEVHIGDRTSLGQSMENLPVDVSWVRAGVPEKLALILRREGAANFTNGTRAGEFDVLRALESSAVATPPARWLDADGTAFGRPTMFLDRLQGAADANALTEFGPAGSDPRARRDLAERMFDQLIALHLIDASTLPLRRTVIRTDPDSVRAEVDSWWLLAQDNMLEPLPELTEVRQWLLTNARPSGRHVLIHGDFRPENVLVDDGDVVAVLDWELSRVSDPLFDLGWYLLPIFLAQHTIPGQWETSQILERYTERTGLEVTADDVLPWSVLGLFQVVAMLQCNQRGFVEGRQHSGFTWWYQQMMLHLLLSMIGI